MEGLGAKLEEMGAAQQAAAQEARNRANEAKLRDLEARVLSVAEQAATLSPLQVIRHDMRALIM